METPTTTELAPKHGLPLGLKNSSPVFKTTSYWKNARLSAPSFVAKMQREGAPLHPLLEGRAHLYLTLTTGTANSLLLRGAGQDYSCLHAA